MHNKNGTIKAEAYQKNSQYILEPSESLLENWKFWIAKEVVVQLRDSKEVKSHLSQITEKLNLSQKRIFSELFEELRQEMSKIKAQISLAQEPDKARTSLEEFFLREVEHRLHQKSQDLKYQSVEYLQNFLSPDFQQASPKKLIKFLEALAKSLFYQKNDFDKQKIYYREQENAAHKAFLKLTTLQESPLEEGIANSLLLIFESQLNIKICDICSYTFFDLIQKCQVYCESSRRSEAMLSKIESSLTAKSSIDFISLPVFSILNEIDVDEQRELLEYSTSHSLNVLGAKMVTWQQVEAKLLQNVEVVARKVCSQFQSRFMDHVVIIKNSENNQGK